MDELFRELKDLDFKANKLLKSKFLDAEAVRIYNSQSLNLKNSLIELTPQDEVNEHLKEISEIDIDGPPPISDLAKFIGVITFGIYTSNLKRYKKQKYFKKMVSRTKNQWIAIEFLLKA
jgi:predicted transcriptional regulator